MNHSQSLAVKVDSNSMMNQSTNVDTVFFRDEKLLATPIGKQTGEQMSVHVLVNDSAIETSDYENYHSLLISAALNADLTIERQSSQHTYQVMCLNRDTQEVVGEGQEVIVQGQSFENNLVFHKDAIADSVLDQR